MVDAISTRGVAGSDVTVTPTRVLIAPTAAVAAARSAEPVARPPEQLGGAAQLTSLARTLAAAPPVDLDRVARLRSAIASGNFPIDRAAIADRLIAFNRGKAHDGQNEDQP